MKKWLPWNCLFNNARVVVWDGSSCSCRDNWPTADVCEKGVLSSFTNFTPSYCQILLCSPDMVRPKISGSILRLSSTSVLERMAPWFVSPKAGRFPPWVPSPQCNVLERLRPSTGAPWEHCKDTWTPVNTSRHFQLTNARNCHFSLGCLETTGASCKNASRKCSASSERLLFQSQFQVYTSRLTRMWTIGIPGLFEVLWKSCVELLC